MRDAFGGAFSIKLMLIFLMLYVFFICVALNYARAFRVKNRIINIIEQNEGYEQYSAVDTEINDYLGKAGYYVDYNDIKKVSSCTQDTAGFTNEGRGYCIVKMSNNPEYYRVETYMVFNIPILGVRFPIQIRGETRKIEKF